MNDLFQKKAIDGGKIHLRLANHNFLLCGRSQKRYTSHDGLDTIEELISKHGDQLCKPCAKLAQEMKTWPNPHIGTTRELITSLSDVL